MGAFCIIGRCPFARISCYVHTDEGRRACLVLYLDVTMCSSRLTSEGREEGGREGSKEGKREMEKERKKGRRRRERERERREKRETVNKALKKAGTGQKRRGHWRVGERERETEMRRRRMPATLTSTMRPTRCYMRAAAPTGVA